MEETLLNRLANQMEADFIKRVRELHPLSHDLYEPKNQGVPIMFDGIYKKLTDRPSQSAPPAGPQ